MAVFIANLGQKGVIVEPPDKRGLALVEVGRLKMRIPAERIQALLPEERKPEPEKPRHSLMDAIDESRKGPSGKASITCDLRGERVDEAVEQVESFLDRAYQNNTPFVYFIHGHGTGRLKAALREHFQRSPYVKSFRPGERGEGRDGVTVAVLKED